MSHTEGGSGGPDAVGRNKGRGESRAPSLAGTAGEALGLAGRMFSKEPGETDYLAALDTMATRPSDLTMTPRLTYLGGPTYLIEIGKFRIISDPGFDPQGTERYEGPGHLLTKIMAPPIPVEGIGRIDLALVSHAQHLDNLDNEGRRLLGRAGTTITTPESASMNLPGKAVRALKTWERTEVVNAAGERLQVTAMPAVHTSNPALRGAVGEVTGFMLEWEGQRDGALYISGDTVWTDEILEIGRRYKVGAAILHMGAANVPAVGDNFLTMNAADGVRVAATLGLRSVFPAHFEGWRHFTQGSWYIVREFEKANMSQVLNLLKPGEARNVGAAVPEPAEIRA